MAAWSQQFTKVLETKEVKRSIYTQLFCKYTVGVLTCSLLHSVDWLVSLCKLPRKCFFVPGNTFRCGWLIHHFMEILTLHHLPFYGECFPKKLSTLRKKGKVSSEYKIINWIVTVQFISVCTTGSHTTSTKINEFDGEFLSHLKEMGGSTITYYFVRVILSHMGCNDESFFYHSLYLPLEITTKIAKLWNKTEFSHCCPAHFLLQLGYFQ